MTLRSNDSLAASRHVSGLAGAAAIAGGCLVLTGWALNIQLLKQPWLAAASMKANTALAFVMTGASLWLLAHRSRFTKLAVILASLAALLGLLTASEDFFRLDLRIDQLLFRDSSTTAPGLPGRMAFSTAACFFALGLGLMSSAGKRNPWAANALAIASGLVSGFAFLGYLYGAPALYGIGPYAMMAPHTAPLLFVLSLEVSASSRKFREATEADADGVVFLLFSSENHPVLS